MPAKLSRNMIRALGAQGWSQDHLKYILENNEKGSGFLVRHVTRNRVARVNKKTEDTVLWLVRAIGERRGPSNMLAVKYRTRGYFPTKHYNVNGDLIVSTLSKEQRKYVKRVP